MSTIESTLIRPTHLHSLHRSGNSLEQQDIM